MLAASRRPPHDRVAPAATACVLALFAAGATGAGAGRVDPSFAPSPVAAAGDDVRSVAVADFDGDGNSDLAIAKGESNQVMVLLGDGAGRFRRSAAPPSAAPSARSILAATLNADARPDLAVITSKGISVLLGDGKAGFTAAPGSPVELPRPPERVVATDLNADGHVDLVAPL